MSGVNIDALAKDHRPVYIQISDVLRARIVSGYYADKIDGELPLAREWKVSRRTIQQALEILVQEGLLVRQHGMGTFINRKGVERRYRAITSITESIRAQGLDPVFTVLESGEAQADEVEAGFFELPEGRQRLPAQAPCRRRRAAARHRRHQPEPVAAARPRTVASRQLALSDPAQPVPAHRRPCRGPVHAGRSPAPRRRAC